MAPVLLVSIGPVLGADGLVTTEEETELEAR